MKEITRQKWAKYVGTTIGKLKIKDMCIHSKDKYGTEVHGFICDCACGKTNFIVRCSGITDGRAKTPSCGCHRVKGEKNSQFTGYKDISGSYYGMLRRSAKNRNLIFDVSIDYLYNLLIKQEYKCAFTGLLLRFERSINRKIDWKYCTASLDRIDSTNGYVKENVQWVHKDINLMKQGYTNEYLIYMSNLISNIHPIDTININSNSINHGKRFCE